MREDLLYADKMIELGWKVVLHEQDRMHNRTDLKGSNPPVNAVAFQKDKMCVWYCKNGIQVAELIDGRYQNHRGKVAATHEPYKGERFNEGYIPDMPTLISLIEKNEL